MLLHAFGIIIWLCKAQIKLHGRKVLGLNSHTRSITPALSFAKPSVRLSLPILATNGGNCIEEMGRVINSLDSAELIVIGAIERLLPIRLIEVGLFSKRHGVSSGTENPW